MKKIFLVIACSLQFTALYGQSSLINRQVIIKNEKENILSGSLAIDSKIAFDKSDKVISTSPDNMDDHKKSVWLAVGLSALIPGAGEFYSENYIKSAAFIAVEVAAITLGLIYDKKGNDQTIFFQNYADRYWSVDRYAAWTIKNATSINSAVDPSKYSVFANGKVNWNELNRLERDLGSYYSHQLPKYGDQQYFELIGKYPQFNVGWDDFGNENTPFVYGDPLTKKFLYYADERGKANNFYNIASKAVLVVVINHIISAVDAAWSTSRYNKNLEASASIERRDYGFNTVYYPRLNLQYRF